MPLNKVCSSVLLSATGWCCNEHLHEQRCTATTRPPPLNICHHKGHHCHHSDRNGGRADVYRHCYHHWSDVEGAAAPCTGWGGLFHNYCCYHVCCTNLGDDTSHHLLDRRSLRRCVVLWWTIQYGAPDRSHHVSQHQHRRDHRRQVCELATLRDCWQHESRPAVGYLERSSSSRNI